jgi:hypothetical protein
MTQLVHAQNAIYNFRNLKRDYGFKQLWNKFILKLTIFTKWFYFQRLLCINPPLFEIHQVLLSPTQHHVALIGSKGLMALELPQRWGKDSEFEGGKATVNCR